MLKIQLQTEGVRAYLRFPHRRAVRRAARKAGTTSLRDMRSEAVRRVRQRKRIKVKEIKRALTTVKPTRSAGVEALDWGLRIDNRPVPLSAYPARQTRRGVRVEVNVGRKSLISRAFVATMPSGHRGIYKRRGSRRLPIDEQFGSTVAHALSHDGEIEAIHLRGRRSFDDTFTRLLPIEMERGR